MQPSIDPRDSGDFVANWIQLSNVSKKRLRGKLYFYRVDGAALSRPVDVNLRDGARLDYSAHAYGANLVGLVRFAPSDKNVEYQLRGVRYLYDNPGGQDSFATAYPFGAVAGSGQALLAPVDTREASAIIELANTLPKKGSVALKVYNNTGKKLLYDKIHSRKDYSSLHIPLDTVLSKTTGLVVARGSHNGSLLGSVVHYGRQDSGAVLNMYTVELREAAGRIFKGS